jgi:Lon protease-like protein
MSENDYLGFSSEIIKNNVIAIVQPKPVFVKGARNKELIRSFKTGCAGKITDINFIGSEEVMVNIYGICRFDVIEELLIDKSGIERISVSYKRFLVDMDKEEVDFDFDKKRLMGALDVYFKNLEISPNWTEIEKTPVNVLISALAMACPFHPSEKQSLLEIVSVEDRSNMMMKIVEMNSFDRYNTASTVN